MKYNFDVKITGIHARDEMINKLKEKLNLTDENIIYDEEALGFNCTKTVLRAMESPHEENITHRLIMPDDMDVCENFNDILTKIINAHPKNVFSLFPFPLEYCKEKIMKESRENPYYFSTYACGNGLCFPIELLDEYREWLFTTYTEDEYYNGVHVDDYYITTFLNKKNIPIITTIPSLVQHLGANNTTLKSGISPGTTSFFIPKIDFYVNWNSNKFHQFALK